MEDAIEEPEESLEGEENWPASWLRECWHDSVFVKIDETINPRVNFTACKGKKCEKQTKPKQKTDKRPKVKIIPKIALVWIIPVFNIFLLSCVL